MRWNGTVSAIWRRRAASSSLTTSSRNISPSGTIPERGYVGGAKGVSLLNQYRGSTYGVCLDGDFQTWVYRTDLFNDPAEQKAFKDKYGYDLAPPKTWKQLDEVSMFFHRPDKNMLGSTDIRNQGWGYTNWYQRYTSMGFAEPVPVRRRRNVR